MLHNFDDGIISEKVNEEADPVEETKKFLNARIKRSQQLRNVEVNWLQPAVFPYAASYFALASLTNLAPNGSPINWVMWLASLPLGLVTTRVLNPGDRKLISYKEDARKVASQSISAWNGLLLAYLVTEYTLADLEAWVGKIEFGDPAKPSWVSKAIPITAVATAIWTIGFTIDTCLRNNAHRSQPFSLLLQCLEDLFRFAAPIFIYDTWIHPVDTQTIPERIAPTSNWVMAGTICMLALIISHVNRRLVRREVEINRRATRNEVQPQYGLPAVIARSIIDGLDTASALVLFFGLAVKYLLADYDLGEAAGVNRMFFIVATVFAAVIGGNIVIHSQAELARQKLNDAGYMNKDNLLGIALEEEQKNLREDNDETTRLVPEGPDAEDKEKGSLLSRLMKCC